MTGPPADFMPTPIDVWTSDAVERVSYAEACLRDEAEPLWREKSAEEKLELAHGSMRSLIGVIAEAHWLLHDYHILHAEADRLWMEDHERKPFAGGTAATTAGWSRPAPKPPTPQERRRERSDADWERYRRLKSS